MLIWLMILILIIALIMMMINFLISKKEYLDREKINSFECGFDMMSLIRVPFSIHFYLISILFLIFDLEVVYLFPMIDLFESLNNLMWIYMSAMIFYILYIGLEFEKKEGALKWFF